MHWRSPQRSTHDSRVRLFCPPPLRRESFWPKPPPGTQAAILRPAPLTARKTAEAMAPRRSAPLTLVALGLLAAAPLPRLGFLGGTAAGRRRGAVARGAFDSGKVNVGVELDTDVPPPPQPARPMRRGVHRRHQRLPRGRL
ncbi:unnamed protein product [Prorocentrum cordatum]|uniref:Uncharacterized protein n=1 Tax=Prorocentrum cordatum TaxID=2364126 RepID=A0ABN9SE22_9DINO|nr:unnamed protein product [Polarella glacialis]